MDINERKQQFSIAYVRAIAAVAGFTTSKPETDDDSVDITLAQKGGNGTLRSPKLDIQLKATSRDIIREDALRFPLPIKNYDDLRLENMVPRILVVHCLPTDLGDWTRHTEEDLLLRHCSYWVSLFGEPPTDNTQTITIPVPQRNQFNSETLSGIMERIGRREPV